MRVVVDANVIISALLAPNGAPGAIMQAWSEGAFELIVSLELFTELVRVAGYRKLRRRIEQSEVDELVNLLRTNAVLVDDIGAPTTIRSRDEGDNYLIALAEASGAVIVSGDKHLLELAHDIAVFSPASFLSKLKSVEQLITERA